MPFSYYFTDPEYMLYAISIALFIPVLIFSVVAQILVQTTFAKYNAVPVSSGSPAKMYVRCLLEEFGVHGVTIGAVRGSLTDNFDPRTKTISLSDSVRNSASVGAVGVACHEAGHAVQHEKKYLFSALRLKLVPVVNLVSRFMWPIFIIGCLFGFASPYTAIGRGFIIAGLVVMGLSMLFALITLPTEFDASRRAYKYLRTRLPADEAAGVKKVLTAAAMTYVASFMLSSLQFLRLLALLLMGRNRNR